MTEISSDARWTVALRRQLADRTRRLAWSRWDEDREKLLMLAAASDAETDHLEQVGPIAIGGTPNDPSTVSPGGVGNTVR